MRLVKGLRREDADAITAAVAAHGPFDSIAALQRASGVRTTALRRLAAADAFNSMGLDRQRALWEIRALRDDPLPIFDQLDTSETQPTREPVPSPGALPIISEPRKVIQDYTTTALSLRAHPLSFIRDDLRAMRVTPAGQLVDESRWPHGRAVAVAGLVLVRQRPATAGGIVFMTLEDETGIANLIIRPALYKRFRKIARHGVIILARGRVERRGEVVHVLTARLEGLDHLLTDLAARPRNFR